MMLQNFQLAVLCLLLPNLAVSQPKVEDWVKLEPVQFYHEADTVVFKKENDPKLLPYIAHILCSYDQSFRYENGAIWVLESLGKDKKLIGNFTVKAMAIRSRAEK